MHVLLSYNCVLTVVKYMDMLCCYAYTATPPPRRRNLSRRHSAYPGIFNTLSSILIFHLTVCFGDNSNVTLVTCQISRKLLDCVGFCDGGGV